MPNTIQPREYSKGSGTGGTIYRTDSNGNLNTFNVNRFLVHSSGQFEISITNTLEDKVTIKEITVDGSPFTNPSPPLPLNLTAGANATIKAGSTFTGTAGSLYTAKISIKFDVDRGTADHFDAGLLKGEYQPG